MWGASIWHRDDVYAIKNNLNERIWRNGQILKFLNPWTFPATESTRLMYIFIFEKVIYSNSHAYFISCEKVSTILETKL